MSMRMFAAAALALLVCACSGSPSRVPDRGVDDLITVSLVNYFVEEGGSRFDLEVSAGTPATQGRKVTVGGTVEAGASVAGRSIVKTTQMPRSQWEEMVAHPEKWKIDIQDGSLKITSRDPVNGPVQRAVVFKREYAIGEHHASATVDWAFQPGDAWQVEASGVVDNGHPVIGDTSPDGEPNSPGHEGFPAPQFNKYGLIGKFGNGAWFVLGRFKSGVYDMTGTSKLILGYNDDRPDDGPKGNLQTWKVVVTIER